MLAAEDSLSPGTINRGDLSQDRSFTPAEQLAYGVTAAPITSIIGRFENQAKTKTSGIDVTLTSRIATPMGPLDVQLNGTYLLSFYYWYAALGGYGDNLASTFLGTRVPLGT